MAFTQIAGNEPMLVSSATAGNGQQHYIVIRQVQPAATAAVPRASIKLLVVENSRQPSHLQSYQQQQQQQWQLSQLQLQPPPQQQLLQETNQLNGCAAVQYPICFGQQQQQQQQQFGGLPVPVPVVPVAPFLPSVDSMAMIGLASEPPKDLQRKHHRSTKKRRRTNKELEMFGRSAVVNERREQFRNETQWMPITQDVATDETGCPSSPPLLVDDISSCVDVITAETNNTTPTPIASIGTPSSSSSSSSWSRGANSVVTSRRDRLVPTRICCRPSPLPTFPWADSREIWETMMSKEDLPGYRRNSWWFSRHAALQPRLRTILLDWLMEVCEEYQLRRETYHVAVDLIDRFLSRTSDVSKRQLQLIGITALFVASKVEEIHPVKVADISYVTGDTCTEREILDQERTLLKVLKWDLTPLTCVSWITVFLQTLSTSASNSGGTSSTSPNFTISDNSRHINAISNQFMTPQYSQHAFIQIMRLIDLCILDPGSLQFPYSVLAAAAVYHTTSYREALHASSYQWTDIASCVQWMSTFNAVLRDAGPTTIKYFDRVAKSETHTLQTHVIDSTTLTMVHRRNQTSSSSIGTAGRATKSAAPES